MKKQAENVIGFMVKTQLRGVRFDRPVIIHYRWIEPNRRRDKDNVAFAKKFIQDSLVHAGVLVNDGWNQIEGFTDDFAVDPKRADAHVHSVIDAPIGRHSEKPAETRDRIVQLAGGGAMIELFARKTAPGWDAWGDEVEGENDHE